MTIQQLTDSSKESITVLPAVAKASQSCVDQHAEILHGTLVFTKFKEIGHVVSRDSVREVHWLLFIFDVVHLHFLPFNVVFCIVSTSVR